MSNNCLFALLWSTFGKRIKAQLSPPGSTELYIYIRIWLTQQLFYLNLFLSLKMLPSKPLVVIYNWNINKNKEVLKYSGKCYFTFNFFFLLTGSQSLCSSGWLEALKYLSLLCTNSTSVWYHAWQLYSLVWKWNHNLCIELVNENILLHRW